MNKITEEELIRKVNSHSLSTVRLSTRQIVALVLNVLSEEYASRPYKVVELLRSRPGFLNADDGT